MEFAEKLGITHQNNVSARLENPNYGKHSLSTLKKIAATCDVAIVVWFIPFSRFLDWVTGTPYLDNGLSETFYNIQSFDQDNFGGDAIGLGSVPKNERAKQEKRVGGADIDRSLPPKRSSSPVPLLGPIPAEMAG